MMVFHNSFVQGYWRQLLLVIILIQLPKKYIYLIKMKKKKKPTNYRTIPNDKIDILVLHIFFKFSSSSTNSFSSSNTNKLPCCLTQHCNTLKKHRAEYMIPLRLLFYNIFKFICNKGFKYQEDTEIIKKFVLRNNK